MAAKFQFHDEVIALLLTDDATAQRLVPLIRNYAFPFDHQATVASAALTFAAEFKSAVKEHAFTILPEDQHAYLRDLFELSRGLHRDYVLKRLDQFLKEGAIRRTISESLNLMQEGEWDQIEKTFAEHSRGRVAYFNPGLSLRGDSLKKVMSQDPQTAAYTTGIRALDEAHVGPAPKTVYMTLAPAKRGKTWGLVHQGKVSLQHRLSVVHITLEMSEESMGRRYVQSMLSLTKRALPEVETTYLKRDSLGRLHGIEFDKVKRPEVSDKLFSHANELLARYKFYIKQFPTGQLTVPDLCAYLDSLEDLHGFVPDILLLDYADLMKLDPRNLRIETGVLFKELRGVAVDRGFALVTASQTNRSSSEVRWVRDDMVAEDWSKIGTADTILTYSQTKEERKLNLARLFVSNARDESDKWGCVITQAYAIGQYCLDSIRLPDETYWKMVDEIIGKPTDGDSEENS